MDAEGFSFRLPEDKERAQIPARVDLPSARWLRSGGVLLLKCQDQVCSGKVRWQTIEFANHAASCGGMTLEDVFMPTGHRPQPGGRRQLHARRNYSSLMVFQKP